MSRRTLTSCLALMVGCNAPAVNSQPLEIAERPVEEAPTPTPEPPDPLREHVVGALAAPIGLIDPGRVAAPDWVTVEPSDLATATAETPPSLVFGPDAPEFEECVRSRECIRLVTYPEGEAVDCEMVAPEPGYGDISRRIMLNPRRALEERWYALEVRMERNVLETTRRGDIQLARFRPDSHPIVTHALASGDGMIEIRFSERVWGDRDASAWTVEDGSGRLPCEVLGPTLERPETRAVLTCERQAEGVLRVGFGTTLHTVLGTELTVSPERAIDQLEFELPARDGLDVAVVVRVPIYQE